MKNVSKRVFIGLYLFSASFFTIYAMDDEENAQAKYETQIIQQLAQQKALIDKQITDIAVLNGQINKYEQEHKKYEQEKQKFFELNERSTKVIDELERGKEFYKSENQKLTQELSNSKITNENIIKDLSNKITHYLGTINTSIEEQTQYKATIEKLNQELAASKITNENFEKSSNNVLSQVESLKKEKQTLLENISNLKTEKNYLDQLSNTQLTNLVAQNKQLEQNKLKIENLEETITTLEDNLTTSQNSNNDLTKLLSQATDCFSIANNDIQKIIANDINYEKANKGVKVLAACAGGAIGGLSTIGFMTVLKCTPQSPRVYATAVGTGMAVGASISISLVNKFQKPQLKPGASVQMRYNDETQVFTPRFFVKPSSE